MVRVIENDSEYTIFRNYCIVKLFINKLYLTKTEIMKRANFAVVK